MDPEVFTDIAFPSHGVDNSHAYGEPLPQTTVSALNARTFEAQTQRGRGGSRPGLARFITDQVPAGTHLIQHLNFVVDPNADALLDSFDWPDDDAVIDPSDLGRGLGRRIRPGGSGRKASKSRKKTPIITWSNPADITQGTALSGTQLNAVAKDPTTNLVVAGSYLYSPSAGTVLDSGDHQALRVTFTPTSPLTYNTARKTVHINVTTPNILFVQKRSTDGSGAGPFALAYTSNVTAGNFLACWVPEVIDAAGAGPDPLITAAVADSLGQTWTQAGVYQRVYDAAFDDWVSLSLWYKANTLGGACTVTATMTGIGASTSATALILGEWSGVKTVAPLNATSGATGSSVDANTGTISASSGQLIVAGAVALAGSVNFGASAPFTIRETGALLSNTVKSGMADDTSASGNLAATLTRTLGAAATWCAIGASFKTP